MLIAAAISAGMWLFYERESALPYEALAIFAVVLLSALMGYIQESRAEEAVAALRLPKRALGLPPSTLDLRIKRLGIDKFQYCRMQK